MLRNFFMGTAWTKSPSINLGLLIIRVFAGITLAFAHGLGKLPPSVGLINTVRALDFPAPEIFAWAAGLSEFLGGIFVAMGLFTRPSAFLIAFTMTVASFGQHADDPFAIKEKALLFLAISIMLLITGSGKYGVDGMFKEKRY